MRRNCNLDLRLLPPAAAVTNFSDDGNHRPPMMGLLDGNLERGGNQHITVMVDGRVSVCDVTELQARAIILHASQGNEEKPNNNSPPLSPSQLCTSPGNSMKKSLQRFLLNRRHRVQATSPY